MPTINPLFPLLATPHHVLSPTTPPCSRYVLLSPKEDLKKNNCQATKYKFYTVAIVISCIALGLLATIVTQMAAPLYLPIVTVLSLMMMPLAVPYAKKMYQTSQRYESQAKIDKLADVKFQQLQKSASSNPKLDAIRAKCEAWNEQVSLIDKEIQELAEAAKKAPSQKEAQGFRVVALHKREVIKRAAKLQAAFLHGLITHPSYLGEVDDLCEASFTPGDQRLIAREFNSSDADTFLTLKQKSSGQISASEFDRLSVSAIAQRLFADIRAA